MFRALTGRGVLGGTILAFFETAFDTGFGAWALGRRASIVSVLIVLCILVCHDNGMAASV
jgi:hypothetical protein